GWRPSCQGSGCAAKAAPAPSASITTARLARNFFIALIVSRISNYRRKAPRDVSEDRNPCSVRRVQTILSIQPQGRRHRQDAAFLRERRLIAKMCPIPPLRSHFRRILPGIRPEGRDRGRDALF